MNENNLPADFAHPGGFIEATMNYINETSVCYQPMFALGAALALAGTLYGRRVQSDDGQRTNLFVFAIGYSSAGKNAPLKAISHILDTCEATHLRLGQVTSDSAIEWALKREPRVCLCLDEAGHFLNNASSEKAKGAPQSSIKPGLLELWSSAQGRWVGKQRVPRDGKEQKPVIVDEPHLCLYATSQPSIILESMSKQDLRDGWLVRNLFFISTTRPKPQPKPIAPIPMAIRGEVLAWKGVSGDTERDPIKTIPTSDEAKEVFSAFNDEIYEKMLEADKSGDESNYLYGKALENAKRIALILAVSRDKEQAVITKADAEYACGLVDYLLVDFIGTVRMNIGETQDEKYKKRIVAIVATQGRNGLLKGELTRLTQFLRQSQRDEYLADLIESGAIQMVEQPRGTRYRLGEYSIN